MKKTSSIANKPAQCVAVQSSRTIRHPITGEKATVLVQFVGCSAREVSAEADEAMRSTAPIVWRFLCGKSSGGDDLKTDPAWREVRIEIPAAVPDATERLEDELGLSGGNWFAIAKK